MQGSTFRCRQGVSFRLPLTTHDTSRLTSLRLGGCDPALSLAVRAAPRDDGLTDPTMGLMRSVMPGRLPDYWSAQQSGDAVPLFRRSVAGKHPHRAPPPPTFLGAMCGRL